MATAASTPLVSHPYSHTSTGNSGHRFPAKRISTSVIRPDDFLAVRFDFYNFILSRGILNPVATPAYIVVNLPPQNIAEQAFYETDGSGIPPNKPDPNSAQLAYDPTNNQALNGQTLTISQLNTSQDPNGCTKAAVHQQQRARATGRERIRRFRVRKTSARVTPLQAPTNEEKCQPGSTVRS